MLIMVNMSLEQLSAFSWVMVLVLKLINYGILKHTKHFIVEMLCSMNLLSTSDLSTTATNRNSESISMHMEHIDDDVAAPPSVGNSSPLRHSSPIVYPPWESLAEAGLGDR
jgi:hypothetical protein